ncbi:hypothetical protein FRC14_000340 [Serendipita sp. 396]|nr:hypothetical protein FRC14_000340 [Serendipita sp. 396]
MTSEAVISTSKQLHYSHSPSKSRISNKALKCQTHRQRQSYTSLPLDIHHLILPYLQWPYDLQSLSLVSRSFHILSTPLLYRTVVFPYARPSALLALLCKLEVSPEYCAMIHTLVFDDVAKPLMPDIPNIGADFDACKSDKLENRVREPVGRKDWILDQVHHKLYCVLPLLNIKSLYLKRLHPVFLSPPLSHTPPIPSATQKVKDAVLNHVPIRQWRKYQQTPSKERLPAAIGMFFTHCRSLASLTIYDPLSLRSYWPHSLVTNLTVIIYAVNLDTIVLELDSRDTRAMQLNGILRRARNLRTLAILTTWISLHLLLEDCHFAHLESIEWFHYSCKSVLDARTFYNFLCEHSGTLRHISLAPTAYIVGSWGFTTDPEVPHWLAEPPYPHTNNTTNEPDRNGTLSKDGFLPNLETLRLHNWLAWSTPQAVNTITNAERIHTAHLISTFILSRPLITDVAITDFPSEIGRALIEGMRETRKVRRAILGREERLRRNHYVPLYPPLSFLHHPSDWNSSMGVGGVGPSAALAEFGSQALSALNPSTLLNNLNFPGTGNTNAGNTGGGEMSERARAKAYWAFVRRREYLLEAYYSYSVMFEGMELEQSGFRPYLLPRRRNAKREYQR